MWRPWDPVPGSQRPGPSNVAQTSNLVRDSSPQPGPSHAPTRANPQRVDENGKYS